MTSSERVLRVLNELATAPREPREPDRGVLSQEAPVPGVRVRRPHGARRSGPVCRRRRTRRGHRPASSMAGAQGHPLLPRTQRKIHNRRLPIIVLLPARRYASANTGYGPICVCLCLYPCLSQVGLRNRVFWRGSFFPLCYKEIQVPSKIRALSS